MHMYTIADSGKGWDWSQHLGFEVVSLVVLLILVGLLTGLGEKGVITAIIAAPIVTVAIF
jgi:hypothetical protein